MTEHEQFLKTLEEHSRGWGTDIEKRHAVRDASQLIAALVEERSELQQSFDLRWNADMRAIKRWQAAHPGNDLVWPDHADLVVWLMEQLDAVNNAVAHVEKKS